MTTTLDTSCSENAMVLSARRGFLHACIFWFSINAPINVMPPGGEAGQYVGFAIACLPVVGAFISPVCPVSRDIRHCKVEVAD